MIYKLLIEPMPAMPVLAPQDRKRNLAFLERFLTCEKLPADFQVPELVLKRNSFAYYDFANESAVPYCSERVVEIFSPIDRDLEFWPIWKDRHRQYFAINVVNLIDCIDQNTSEGSRDDQGRLISLRKYSFTEPLIPQNVLMFRIPQLKSVGRIFVTERFVTLVKEERLTGVAVRDPNDGLKKGLHGLPFAAKSRVARQSPN